MSTDAETVIESAPDAQAPEAIADEYSLTNEITSGGQSADEESATVEGGEAAPEVSAPEPISRQDYAELGLSEDQARQLQQAGTLDLTLNALAQRYAAIGQQALEAGTGETPPVETPPVQQLPVGDAEPLKITFDPEVFGEDVAKTMNGMVEQVNQRLGKIQAVEQMLAKVMQQTTSHAEALQAQRHAAFIERTDAWFNSLGQEYEDLIGKGTVNDIKPGTPQHTNRAEIVRMMDAMEAGFIKTGAKIPEEAVLREMAKNVVLGNHVHEVVRKQVAAQTRDAQGKFIAKPTNRESKPLTGIEAAAARAENAYRKAGAL